MLLAQLRKTIHTRELLSEGAHVLVACSGGPDSMALAHALHSLRGELGVTLAIASVDHALRPAAKDEVVQVLRFADALGVPGYGLAVNISQGPSMQDAARSARYRVLAEQAQKCGATHIATGHTQNDQAETVLARLLRGAGCLGLAAIQPLREDAVIRPLIDVTREEVEAYVAHHNLPAVRDPSNQDLSFERVRVRNKLLPALREEDPRVIRHLAALADEALSLRIWLNELLAQIPSTSGTELEIARVLEQPLPLHSMLLSRWILEQTKIQAGREHLVSVSKLLRASGEVLLGSNWVVLRRGNHLVLEHREP